jgi:hypothetical protein
MKKNICILFAFTFIFVYLIVEKIAVASEITGTVQYENVPIQVSIGKVSNDDKNNTTVKVLMNFEVAIKGFNPDVAMKAASKTIKVKIIAQNEIFEASEFSIDAGGCVIASDGKSLLATVKHIIYHFNTDKSPEKIIVFTEQDSGLTFNGETKEIITD